MFHIILLFILSLLLASFILLLTYNISKKLGDERQAKKNHKSMELIKEKIGSFFGASKKVFKTSLEEFAAEAMGKGKNYRDNVDSFLLDSLETARSKNRDKLISIAKKLNFTSDCLDQIKSRTPELIAIGSRRAGLYNLTEAADEMVATLEFLSSENQFEILMALARMGNSTAMQKAFSKIRNNIIINERAVIDILSAFPEGDEKLKFFRSMIHGDTNYLSALFLKAMKKEMVQTMESDIIALLHDGNKEIRAASLRALATLGNEAPANELIKALNDTDWEVRALAAKAMGPVMSQEASLALFKVLKDHQWWVRQNAAAALVNHHEAETLFILAAEMGDEYTRDSIISALEDSGNPILLRSIKVMAD